MCSTRTRILHASGAPAQTPTAGSRARCLRLEVPMLLGSPLWLSRSRAFSLARLLYLHASQQAFRFLNGRKYVRAQPCCTHLFLGRVCESARHSLNEQEYASLSLSCVTGQCAAPKRRPHGRARHPQPAPAVPHWCAILRTLDAISCQTVGKQAVTWASNGFVLSWRQCDCHIIRACERCHGAPRSARGCQAPSKPLSCAACMAEAQTVAMSFSGLTLMPQA